MKFFCRRVFPVFLGLLIFSAAVPAPALDAVNGEALSLSLREWLDAAARSRQAFVGCEPVHASKDLIDFYAQRAYQPVWVSPRGASEAARDLLSTLADAERHGLLSQDYHFPCLSEWLKNHRSDRSPAIAAKELAGMEIVLSDAFVNFATHLAAGKVDPQTIHPQWVSPRKKTEVFQRLAAVAASRDLRAILEELAPGDQGYRDAMSEAHRLRRRIATGGWREIDPGETLRPGDHSPRVAQVRARLMEEGDLPSGTPSAEETVFGDALVRAVVRFQHRHGLAPDGVVGPQTLAALNRSPEDRLRCVLVNLERWRWIPRDLGRRHIIVNPAAFTLEGFREELKVLEMPVIVGESYTRTPVFSGDMTHLVVNPFWNVPPGVLARKILPKIKKNPGYLAANHFELVRGSKQTTVLLNPSLIDWSRVHAGNFPGRLRQRPGPWNSLGRIKFIFPNDFAVYLHDTPDRHLFDRTDRAFSSGCIRVKKPVELALFVLEPDPAWNRERLEQVLAGGKPTTVRVKDPVTVHLQYWTFWIGADGQAQYRKDIYDRDGVLWSALNTVPSAPQAAPAQVQPEVDPNLEVEPAG